MSLRIATRGDDAGSCQSANRAVVQAATEGVLKNISVMVPGPEFAHAVPMLQQLKGVDLGLHVVLNSEWDSIKWGPILPPAAVSSLVEPSGAFTAFPNILNERGLDLEQAIAEVTAQLRLAREAGLNIVYLDQHMGVGWVGGLDVLLRELADREGLLWVDDLPNVRSVSDIQALYDQESTGDYMYVTHPGYAAADMWDYVHAGLEPGQIAEERDRDRQGLVAPETLQMVSEGIFQPVRFSEVL